MGILSLEIKFSKIGVNQLSSNQDKIQKSVTYIPVAVVQFEGESKKKRIYLSSIVSDKKSIKQVIAGDTFICLQIDDEYEVHNLDGVLQGSIPSEKYGNLLQVNENSFILLKESTITFISDKGEIAGSRMLNEEELSAIK
ncbi:MAG: hypothetical protein MJ000_05425 [Bacteroidales bacterium]|nr:hypothetical protein [Bacteroidales bacterium]